MAKTTKKKETPKETAVVVTRAEKKDATKNLIKERLAVKPYKHNELIEEVANLYTERFGGEDTDNINDVKGRVGSVLDIMKKDSDIMYEGGMYALKARTMPEEEKKQPAKKAVKKAEATEQVPVEKPAKKTAKKAKAELVKEETVEVKTEEKPVKKAAKKTKKAEPLPAAPIQPIAPVAPVTPEVAPEPIPTETSTPKKRGRKTKAKTEEIPVQTEEKAPVTVEVKPIAEPPKSEETDPVKSEAKSIVEEKQPEPVVETPIETVTAQPKAEEKATEPSVAADGEPKTELVVKTPAPIVKKDVMDMSFLFTEKKPVKQPEKEAQQPEKTEKKPAAKVELKTEKQEEKPVQKAEKKPEAKVEIKPAPKAEAKPEAKTENKPENKPVQKPQHVQNVRKLTEVSARNLRKPALKAQTADEKLCEAFLKRIRSLGGDYFEYYSIYLLERYSMKNGRRLEGLRISGGDRDGGIDGEIELTDKLGFKETIYIQSKNWNPEKGDEKLWVVGETLLQQFIGACVCRQAKDGKQNCRGIFITTSRFTPEAKRILDTMSDKIVGYDGNDLYEAAKECSFGLVEKNGVWTLDERVLSGSKIFFNLY